MIAAGVNPKALATYMGHSSITITLDRYGHLMPGSEAEAAGMLRLHGVLGVLGDAPSRVRARACNHFARGGFALRAWRVRACTVSFPAVPTPEHTLQLPCDGDRDVIATETPN